MLRRSRPSRSVDYLLAILSPVDVVEATQRYVASQSADALRAHAHRAIGRMRSAERRELAIAFGQAVPRTDNPLFDDAAPDQPELLALIDGSVSLHQRFASFLQQNPRALRTLDPEAVNDILRPLVVHARAAIQPGTRDPDNGDDLRKSLISALPSMQAVRARRWSRSMRAAARSTSRRISAAPGTALAALLTVLRWVAYPFVVMGQATVTAVVALGGAIARIPQLLLAAVLWIAQPLVFAARVLAAGAMAVARAIARIPDLLLALLRLLVLPFVLAARSLARAIARIPSIVLGVARAVAQPLALVGRAIRSATMALVDGLARIATAFGQSIARAVASIPSIAAAGFLAMARPCVLGWGVTRVAAVSLADALGRAAREFVRALANTIAQVPGRLRSALRRIAKPCRVGVRAFEVFVARLAFEAVTGLILLYALVLRGAILLRRVARTIAAESARALRRVPPLAAAGAQHVAAVGAIAAAVIASALATIPPAARKGLRWLLPRVSALAILLSAVLFMIATMAVVAIVITVRVLVHAARVCARLVEKLLQQIPPLAEDALTWSRPRVLRATSTSVDVCARVGHLGVERIQTNWPRVRAILRTTRKRATRVAISAIVMAVAVAFVAAQQSARLCLWAGRRTMAARPWQYVRAVPLLGIGGALLVLVLLMIVPQRIANEHAVRGIAKAKIHPHKIHIAQFHRAAPSMQTVVFIASPLPAATVHPRRVARAAPTPTPMRVMTIATLLNPKKFPVHHEVRIPHVGAAPVAHHPQTVAQGAEQQVLTYLISLSRGDDRAALRTLGMSPTASRDVIPEAALVHSATDFRILNSHTTDAYDATVSVDIRAPQGDYLALYTLSNDGSGMRIVYHSVIPNSAKAPALLSTR